MRFAETTIVSSSIQFLVTKFTKKIETFGIFVSLIFFQVFIYFCGYKRRSICIVENELPKATSSILLYSTFQSKTEHNLFLPIFCGNFRSVASAHFQIINVYQEHKLMKVIIVLWFEVQGISAEFNISSSFLLHLQEDTTINQI